MSASSGAAAPVFDHRDVGTAEEAWLAADGWLAVEALDAGGLLHGVRHLVVLSAHPDDETLACGGLLSAAGMAGVPVTVVLASLGEASHPDSPTHTPEDLARLRRHEVTHALAALAPDVALLSLGLPDGRLQDHEHALVAALGGVVRDGALVLAPWRLDGHTDHETAGRVAARVCAARQVPLLEYPIWWWHWGDPASAQWSTVLRLDLAEETQDLKKAALAEHVTQVQPLSDQAGDEQLLSETFLSHFRRAFETYLRGEPVADGVGPVTDAAAPFDAMFDDGEDPWQFETSAYEQRKRAVTMSCLPRERFGSVLEVGCSTGVLTAELARRADRVVAVDVSPRALAVARARFGSTPSVQLMLGDTPQWWPPGSYDLVVLSEVGYFWTADQLGRALQRSVASLTDDGLLLLCHWRHPMHGWPLSGDAVHRRAHEVTGLACLVSHVEDDFRLDILGRPGRPTPAALEGRS